LDCRNKQSKVMQGLHGIRKSPNIVKQEFVLAEMLKDLGVMVDSKRLAVSTMLGVVAFISKGFLPTPIDKMFVVVQALSFALASLLMRRLGATYASAVNGALLSIVRSGFFPFSLVFSIIYGLLIDGFFRIFKVKTDDHVKNVRLIASLTLSTAITGLVSTYITTLIGLMPITLIFYLTVFVAGVLNGVAASYITTLIWNKCLRHF